MLQLRVQLDPHSGFCFGVVYAIQMAEDLLAERGYLYCLGDIVHNDAEVARLGNLGLRIIDHAQLAELSDEPVLIRAHGEPPATYRLALARNLTLIDASCPVVLKLQNRIKSSYDRGEKLYLYGKRGHAEVLGLQGQTNGEAIVFESLDELLQQDLPSELTLYSQTTKSTESFYRIVQELESRGKRVNANDTICRQVANRDEELRTFAQQFDAVVFVAGTKSSNGKVLFDACRRVNPRTHFVASPSDVTIEWFAKHESVGVCGATSTPAWLMAQVRDALAAL